MRRWNLLLLLLLPACSLWTVPTASPPPLSSIPTSRSVLTPPDTLPPSSESAPTTTPVPSDVASIPDPTGYLWSLVYGGLERPVDIQHAGDARLFVVEQAGVIRIIEGGQVRPDPFLDIRDRVGDEGSEQGLLGLAFHPSYATNGAFFVDYTDNLGNTVIARYRVSANPDRADPQSETVLLHIQQPYANHNGGGLAFGPDRYLYIATGDGGSAGDPEGNGQRLDTLLGKLLRLDVDSTEPYAIPPDNPFRDGTRPEIWAYGLRNPWRFAFDRLTGDLYIGDVGQGDWEEIDFQPAGAPGGINYGWNLREGVHPYTSDATAGLTDPVAEYSHASGCSVTGGVVVRSPSLPEWTGVYLYGDYCSGRIWGMVRDERGMWQNAALFETGLRISSFGVDAEAEVYLLDYGGGLYRLGRAP